MEENASDSSIKDSRTDRRSFFEYPFSTRAWRVFERLKVGTFQELSEFTELDVLRGHGPGKKTLLEIKIALATVGLGLGGGPPYAQAADPKQLEQLLNRQVELEVELQQIKRQIRDVKNGRQSLRSVD